MRPECSAKRFPSKRAKTLWFYRISSESLVYPLIHAFQWSFRSDQGGRSLKIASASKPFSMLQIIYGNKAFRNTKQAATRSCCTSMLHINVPRFPWYISDLNRVTWDAQGSLSAQEHLKISQKNKKCQPLHDFSEVKLYSVGPTSM